MFPFVPLGKRIEPWPAGKPDFPIVDYDLLRSLADEIFLIEKSPFFMKTAPTITVGKQIEEKTKTLGSQLTNLYFSLLKDAKVAGRTVAVINKDKVILGDISIDWRHPRVNHKFRGWKLIRPAVQVSGKTLLLAATGAETFSHLLFDSIGRIWLAERAGFSLDYFDNILVQEDSPLLREILSFFFQKIPKVICLSNARHVLCKNLYVGSYQSAPGHYHPDFLKWLWEKKQKLLKNTCLYNSEAIFISRASAKARRLINEKEVFESIKLRKKNLVQLELLSFHDQLALFTNAKIVLAPHGAGLSLCVWLKEGATVAEFFPEKFFNGYYWELCSHKQVKYGAMEGKNSSNTISPNSNYFLELRKALDFVCHLLKK